MNKIILGCNQLLACFRAARVACHIFYGMLFACTFPLLNQDLQQRIQKHWACKLLDMMHVRFEAHYSYNPANMSGSILVANHISWLDVLALKAVVPASFVAKSEIRSWPLLGWLCHRAGTLFVKRNLRRDTVRINSEITGILKQGKCIALFPEGTSTDSELPGHFHSSLLQAAIDIDATICPVAIRYHDEAGNFSSDAAFVGDMSFIQSLWKVLCSPSLHVTLLYLPPLSCAGNNRRLMAVKAQESIHTALAELSASHSVCIPNAAIPVRWQNAISST